MTRKGLERLRKDAWNKIAKSWCANLEDSYPKRALLQVNFCFNKSIGYGVLTHLCNRVTVRFFSPCDGSPTAHTIMSDHCCLPFIRSSPELQPKISPFLSTDPQSSSIPPSAEGVACICTLISECSRIINLLPLECILHLKRCRWLSKRPKCRTKKKQQHGTITGRLWGQIRSHLRPGVGESVIGSALGMCYREELDSG